MARSYGGVESFYGGGGSSLEPDPNGPFVGYRLSPAQIGFSTNPTTGDQLKETIRGIQAGAKVIEVNLLRIGIQGGGDSDQVIPKQHFEEIRALSKLTGVSPSIHGPLIDAAGFSEQRGVWSEENRADNERIMFAAMEKAKITDPDKNIPVIFHSSNMLGSGTSYVPGKDKKGKTIFKEEVVPMFNQQSKQLVPIEEKEHYHIGATDEKFGKIRKIDDTIRVQNNTTWENELKSLTLEKKYGDEMLNNVLTGADLKFGLAKGMEIISGGDRVKDLTKGEVATLSNQLVKAETLLENNGASFDSLFGQAYEYGNPNQQKALKKMSDDWREDERRIKEGIKGDKGLSGFAKDALQIKASSDLQDEYLQRMKFITGRGKIDSSGNLIRGGDEENSAPKTFIRGEEFAMEEAAKTFGNVAAKSYKKLGGNAAPIVAIENVWNGAMFSRGEDMKKIVEKSREAMVKNLMGDGIGRSQAENAAEKLIGMNFDVGHMNIFRKKGFTTEDMTKEIKEFAPYVKHMHLTDNFGFSDEHLYPGQGNVPFKEFFKELSKKNPTFDKDVKKIVETGGVEARHMGGRSAHAFNLAAFGVPIFGAAYGGGAPTFDRALDTFGSYSGGYGDVSPEIHHSMFGAGYSNLPVELGGIIPGTGTGRSRFGGAPMQ